MTTLEDFCGDLHIIYKELLLLLFALFHHFGLTDSFPDVPLKTIFSLTLTSEVLERIGM